VVRRCRWLANRIKDWIVLWVYDIGKFAEWTWYTNAVPCLVLLSSSFSQSGGPDRRPYPNAYCQLTVHHVHSVDTRVV